MKLNLGFTKSYFPLVDSQYLFFLLQASSFVGKIKDSRLVLVARGRSDKQQKSMINSLLATKIRQNCIDSTGKLMYQTDIL